MVVSIIIYHAAKHTTTIPHVPTMQYPEGGGFCPISGHFITQHHRDICHCGREPQGWTTTPSLLSAVGEEMPDEELEDVRPGGSGYGDLPPPYTGASTFTQGSDNLLYQRWELPDEPDLRSEEEDELYLVRDDGARWGRKDTRITSGYSEGVAERLYNLFYTNLNCPQCCYASETMPDNWTVEGLLQADTRMEQKEDANPARRNEPWKDELGEATMPDSAVLYACGHTKIVQYRGTQCDHLGRYVLPTHTEGRPNTPNGHGGQPGYSLSS